MLFQNGNLSNLRHKTGSSIIEAPQRTSQNYINIHKPIKDDLEFDLDLDAMLNSEKNSGLGLNPNLNLDLDQESELEPESELESEIQAKSDLEIDTEFDTDAQTEPETEEEPELVSERERRPQPRTRSHSPWRNYFTAYRFGSSPSQSQVPPHSRSSEKKQTHGHPNSPQFDEDTW